MAGQGSRGRIKSALARLGGRDATPAAGLTTLIYHRIGGDTPDERDCATADFAAHCEVLARHRVVPLDQALAELADGDDRPKVVLTFDDGFADVESTALPLLRHHGLPFTLYVATAYVGGLMHWDGSTAKAPGPALTWAQLETLALEPLCTIGNHTHTHARPEKLTVEELEACTDALQRHLGVAPRHFAYTWGIGVPAMEGHLRVRFASAVTGRLGRDHPGADPIHLHRVPVRQTDPIDFFQAKLTGRLLPERSYAAIVAAAKRVGLTA
ncbi:MAG TPA: polysaccharide deacetylase family protein [Euzebya sp.]|nr:polysaccharide deacetylase family protein [Euzebya sp.]